MLRITALLCGAAVDDDLERVTRNCVTICNSYVQITDR
jgi:hypothetical protein